VPQSICRAARSIPEPPGAERQGDERRYLAALAGWEDDAGNRHLLTIVPNCEVDTSLIDQCVRMVLIPAAADMPNEVGASGRGSVLNALIGRLVDASGSAALQQWEERHRGEIDELNRQMKEGIKTSIAAHESRVNGWLSDLVPDANLEFDTTIAPWKLKPDASVRTTVRLDGAKNDVSRQGHGVQRAVMMAVFQSLVADGSARVKNHDAVIDTSSASEDDVRSQGADGPSLIIGIEEPEIYQHPVRARSFARVLAKLCASSSGSQVILATHSPYFVRPDQFGSLRRFGLRHCAAKVRSTSIAKVAETSGCTERQVAKFVQKYLPLTFSEGYFAEAVVLVEGETDKVVVEAVADLLDQSLDSFGIAVLDVSGKKNFRIPFALLTALHVPVYVVVDGDALGAGRKYADNQARQAESHESHRNDTNAILGWLPEANVPHLSPYTFGDPTFVGDRYAVWQDDIESELSTWATFAGALDEHHGRLRQEKNLLKYRAAVLDSDGTDMPESLKHCVEAIVHFRDLNREPVLPSDAVPSPRTGLVPSRSSEPARAEP
jgi:putative ATP-dependent endonuclease of the OLD family